MYIENAKDLDKDFIVNASPNGLEIALLEDNLLVELHQEKVNNNFAIGDIFLGRVKKTVAGLNAAFVDIGFGKDAFLHYTDLGPQVRSLKKCVLNAINENDNLTNLDNFELEPDIVKTGKISDVINKRDLLLVQVFKEPIASKGPRLRSEISLPGKFVVLTPFSNVVAISRKIKQGEERDRLTELFESIRPKNLGVIVRTAAEGKKVAELHDDLNEQIEKWERIVQQIKNTKATEKVFSDNNGQTSNFLKDLLSGTFNSVVTNDKGVLNEVQNYVQQINPELVQNITLYNGRTPIFDHFKVTKQVKLAFGKTVGMSSGAYLIVEHTEAMHVIDVNSGFKMYTNADQQTTALTVNLESANEIARQMRLRDLGGIIIIDFIDLKDPENKKMLFRRMKEAMQNDRAQHTILPLSKFGTMQITRQRTRPEVQVSTAEVCPTCKGTGKVKATILIVDEIASNLSYMLNELDYQQLKIVVHPFVEAYLKKNIISIQWKWFWQHKKWVSIAANSNYHLTEYHFYDGKNEEIKL